MSDVLTVNPEIGTFSVPNSADFNLGYIETPAPQETATAAPIREGDDPAAAILAETQRIFDAEATLADAEQAVEAAVAADPELQQWQAEMQRQEQANLRTEAINRAIGYAPLVVSLREHRAMVEEDAANR